MGHKIGVLNEITKNDDDAEMTGGVSRKLPRSYCLLGPWVYHLRPVSC